LRRKKRKKRLDATGRRTQVEVCGFKGVSQRALCDVLAVLLRSFSGWRLREMKSRGELEAVTRLDLFSLSLVHS
jgi:hypothetical protein